MIVKSSNYFEIYGFVPSIIIIIIFITQVLALWTRIIPTGAGEKAPSFFYYIIEKQCCLSILENHIEPILGGFIF